LRPRLPFWTSSGLWASLSSVSNRLSFLRQLSPCVRLLFLLRGVLKIRSPESPSIPTPASRVLPPSFRFPFGALPPSGPALRSTVVRVYGERRYSLISSSNRVNPTLSEHPVLSLSERFRCHFLQLPVVPAVNYYRLLSLARLLQASGPFSLRPYPRVRPPRPILVLEATLCSFFTTPHRMAGA
jgi:hypothetical protein